MSNRHTSHRVPGEELAEWLLGVVTSHARAEAIVGDLSEQAAARSTVWFWKRTLQIAVACAQQNLFSRTTQETDMMRKSNGFLRAVWAHKWLLATCVVLSVVTTSIALSYLPARYRSQTVILVVPQRIPESYVRSTLTSTLNDRLDAIRQQVLSRSRLERVVKDLDLYPDERTRMTIEDVVDRMRNDISVQMLATDSFEVGFEGDEPRTVQRVVDRLATLFIDENLRDRDIFAQNTAQFLESQIEDVRRQIERQEQQLNEQTRAGHPPSRAESIEYDVLQQEYRELLIKRQSARISANLERRQIGEQFKLLDAARMPTKPIAPNKLAVNAEAACAGLGLGAILIGFTSRRRRDAVDRSADDAS